MKQLQRIWETSKLICGTRLDKYAAVLMSQTQDWPPQTFLFWRDHTRDSSCGHGYSGRSLGGAPGPKRGRLWCKTWGKKWLGAWNMYRGLLCAAHLDDVICDDELRWFGFALFIRWTRRSQPKDPLHLVLETLLTWLFIHGFVPSTTLRLWLMAAGRKEQHT